MKHPVQIIGGGLAGLSLGRILARQGVAVSLTEAGSYPRHKVCGEFIAGLSPEVLKLLSLEEALKGSRQLQTVAWFRADRQLARWQLPQAALGLSRYVLDQRLAEEFVAAGGELHENRRGPLPAPEDTAGARGIVQTTGRLPAPKARPRWVGLKRHYRELRLHADLEVHLFPGGYLGLSVIEDRKVNVCGLFPSSAVRGSEDWVEQLPSLGLRQLHRRLRQAIAIEASSSAVAALDFSRDSRGVPWMRLGDSAGMIPPFTGHGMSLAFASAALALPPLLAYARGEADWKESLATVRRQQRHQFRRRLLVARLLHPLLVRPGPQAALAFLATRRSLPFTPLYHLTHA